MPDYQKGKIYQITSHQTTDVYIGSTTQALSIRMAQHRRHLKGHQVEKRPYCSSFILLQYDDAKIELIEEYPCDNKEQLDRREGQLIRERACVNKYISGGMTVEEAKIRHNISSKKYYEANKQKAYEANRKWKKANTESINEANRKWKEAKEADKEKAYEANKQKAYEASKKWKEANREKVNKQQRIRWAKKKEKALADALRTTQGDENRLESV